MFIVHLRQVGPHLLGFIEVRTSRFVVKVYKNLASFWFES